MAQVAVIGAAACTPEEYETARAVGHLLAENNVTIVCGGRGGVKGSGLGREGPRFAIEEMTGLRLMVINPDGGRE